MATQQSRAYNRVYYHNHKKKILARTKAYRRKYHLQHREEKQIKHRLWAKSPEGVAYFKRYRRTPEYKLKLSAYTYNRRTKTKDLTVNIIQDVYEHNIKLYGTLTCYLCLNPILFGSDNLEHKIPLIRGGSNKKENLAVACKDCNTRKGAKTEEEFNAKYYKKTTDKV